MTDASLPTPCEGLPNQSEVPEVQILVDYLGSKLVFQRTFLLEDNIFDSNYFYLLSAHIYMCVLRAHMLGILEHS